VWVRSFYILVRAIPLKRLEGGEEIFRDLPGQNVNLFTPWTKTGIFLTPSDTKQDLYPPRTYLFLLSPRQFCSILPPSDSFPANFAPLGQFFCQFYPPRTAFSNYFTPLGHFILTILLPSDIFFDDFTPLGQFFLRPPDILFFTSSDKNKDFPYPPGQGNLTPWKKRRFPPPPPAFLRGHTRRQMFFSSLLGLETSF